MIELPTVLQALPSVQEIIRADGGDLVLERVEGATVHLRLVVETAACAECVLPRAMLEQVATRMLKPDVPGLQAVVVQDPREGLDA